MRDTAQKRLWYHVPEHARDVANRIMARRYPTPRLDVIVDEDATPPRAYIVVLAEDKNGRDYVAGYLAEDLATVLPQSEAN